MRILKSAVITGPTGAIGAALCRFLLNRGVNVYAIVRPDSRRQTALPVSERLRIVLCDGAELSGLAERIPDGADAFFHLAWSGTVGAGRNNMSAQIDNIRWTLDAVHAAADMGCCVFVGAGSQAEYGRRDAPLRPDSPCFPETGYGMAKLCAGQMSRMECARLGLDHIWMRILSVYGPGDSETSLISMTIRKLLAGERPALTAGEQMWDYLYADDAAEALYLAAVHGRNGAVYPLGGGKARPLREYAEILRDAVSPGSALGFGETPYSLQQVMFLQANIDALRDDTGFQPRIPFEEGIQRTITYMKELRHVG